MNKENESISLSSSCIDKSIESHRIPQRERIDRIDLSLCVHEYYSNAIDHRFPCICHEKLEIELIFVHFENEPLSPNGAKWMANEFFQINTMNYGKNGRLTSLDTKFKFSFNCQRMPMHSITFRFQLLFSLFLKWSCLFVALCVLVAFNKCYIRFLFIRFPNNV